MCIQQKIEAGLLAVFMSAQPHWKGWWNKRASCLRSAHYKQQILIGISQSIDTLCLSSLFTSLGWSLVCFFKQVPIRLFKYFQISFFFHRRNHSMSVYSAFPLNYWLQHTAHSKADPSHHFSSVKTGHVAGAQVQPPDTLFALLFFHSWAWCW